MSKSVDIKNCTKIKSIDRAFPKTAERIKRERETEREREKKNAKKKEERDKTNLLSYRYI